MHAACDILKFDQAGLQVKTPRIMQSAYIVRRSLSQLLEICKTSHTLLPSVFAELIESKSY